MILSKMSVIYPNRLTKIIEKIFPHWYLSNSADIFSGYCDSGPLFSKSVFDIKTRPVLTVELGTKWMPNSDSPSKLMPKCKILGQYDLPNYFYSCLKIAVF